MAAAASTDSVPRPLLRVVLQAAYQAGEVGLGSRGRWPHGWSCSGRVVWGDGGRAAVENDDVKSETCDINVSGVYPSFLC
jgi:hypothetical protein